MATESNWIFTRSPSGQPVPLLMENPLMLFFELKTMYSLLLLLPLPTPAKALFWGLNKWVNWSMS